MLKSKNEKMLISNAGLKYKQVKNESFEGGLEPEDWTIVNTKENGGDNHYGVKLWSGAGYYVEPYSVWADGEWDALNRVAEYCKEKEPGMVVSHDAIYQDMVYYMGKEIEKNPEEYGYTEEQLETAVDEDIVKDLEKRDNSKYWELWGKVWSDSGLEEMYTTVDDPTVFLRSENLGIVDWPDDYPSPEDVVR